MEYWDSFDMQVQCEEVYNPLLMPEWEDPESEDIMDSPLYSLDALKEADGGSYRMEEAIPDAEEFDWLWDSNQAHRELENISSLRKVGVM
jgi:hypothetical protein